jgi:hypothetical protein
MNVVLLRVGIDSGAGGMQGPLFKDDKFEFVYIPDENNKDERTYGSYRGKHGRKLFEYFPERRQPKMKDQSMHVDPEFETFTYGDPTRLKSGLRHLKRGDLLVFYCGLEGWDFKKEPALYLIGYFEVLKAGKDTDFKNNELQQLCGKNFHVMHKGIKYKGSSNFILVKGTNNSRLLKKAKLISTMDHNKAGKPIKVLSPEMRRFFGDFTKKNSIQRSPPRWVKSEFVEKAADFVKSLK